MRTTAAWAFWRRLQYYGLFAVIVLLICTVIYIRYFAVAPTCFDNRQNGDETGVDCGGACTRICAFEVQEPSVLWSRSFKITDGQYNAVAYVENRNQSAGTPALSYTFSLYDNDGLITERSGTTVLPPNSVYPIFEGRIVTGGRVPTRTFLELEPPELWLPSADDAPTFTIVERTLSGADSSPRLDVVLRNNDLEEVREVEVIATIFDKERNALTASRTSVERFAPRSETDLVFTWPQPIAKTIRSCEIPTDVVLAIDLSGSMNDDGDMPPEPISSVLTAAGRFVERLRSNDQASVVTFATDAAVRTTLTDDLSAVQTTISGLSIAPAEETGSTNTGDAFARARDVLASAEHNENARKVLVLLTDGLATAPGEEPEAYALAQASTTRAADIEVYAIALGENADLAFVSTLAGDTANAFQALSSSDIDRIYREITGAICEDGPAVIEVVPKTEATFPSLDRR